MNYIFHCVIWFAENLLLPILCSVVASFAFWRISSKRLSTEIKFAPNIEKSLASSNSNRKRFRIKLLNTGSADIYEAEYTIQFSYVPQKGIRRVLTLNISQRFRTPVLYGKKHQQEHPENNYSRILEILEPEDFYLNFTDRIHKDHIINAAERETLTLEQVFDEYRKSMRITLLVFGIDSCTGIRRFFKSQTYKGDDIKEGKYQSCSLEGMEYSEYVKTVLDVDTTKV